MVIKQALAIHEYLATLTVNKSGINMNGNIQGYNIQNESKNNNLTIIVTVTVTILITQKFQNLSFRKCEKT